MSLTAEHYLQDCIPACLDYERAEVELSEAFSKDMSDGAWRREAQHSTRRALQAATSIEGLYDRAATELDMTQQEVRGELAELCSFPGGGGRGDAVQRMSSIANAYKHFQLDKPFHVINDADDVVSCGSGFGIDGFGVGKFGAPEVLINTKDGHTWKFMGDVVAVMFGWMGFVVKRFPQIELPKMELCGAELEPAEWREK